MSSSSMSAPGRNDLCPCGSGKKYKRCCMAVAREAAAPGSARAPQASRTPWIAAAFVVLAAVAVLAVVFIRRSRDPLAVAGPAETPGATPAPWFYDAAFDRHWHPEHAHWHSGPPPLLAGLPVNQGPEALPAEIPAPWHHDVANNRHWHPGHAHWHEGPPPPEAERR